MNKIINQTSIMKNIKNVFKSVAFYFLFSFATFFSAEMMRTTAFGRNLQGFWTEELYCSVNFFYSLILFFALSEFMLQGNHALKIAFAGCTYGGRTPYPQVKKLSFIIMRPCFWIDIIVFSVLSMISNGATLFNNFQNGFPDFIICDLGLETPFLLTVTAVLKLIAYFACISLWQQNPQKLRTDVATLTIVRKEQETTVSDYIGYAIVPALKIILITILWGVGGSVLRIFYPMLTTVLAIGNEALIPILSIAISVTLLLCWLRWLKICYMRSKTLKKIKQLCREKEFEFTNLGGAFFGKHSSESCHFIINAKGKQIACRFIGVANKSTDLIIDENGTYSKIFWHRMVTENYAFNCDVNAQKMLIICPSSNNLFAKDEHSKISINYGDSMLEYKIEDARGAIRYIDLF